jgi:SSS family solute:Na+ symporter
MKKPFGNKHSAFAGILAGGAVLAFMMTTSSNLGTLFPAAPVVFKSLNIGLVALATNALVFVIVALFTRRAAPRLAGAQPA